MWQLRVLARTSQVLERKVSSFTCLFSCEALIIADEPSDYPAIWASAFAALAEICAMLMNEPAYQKSWDKEVICSSMIWAALKSGSLVSNCLRGPSGWSCSVRRNHGLPSYLRTCTR